MRVRVRVRVRVRANPTRTPTPNQRHPAVAALVEAQVLAQELRPQLDHLGQRRARLGLGRA